MRLSDRVWPWPLPASPAGKQVIDRGLNGFLTHAVTIAQIGLAADDGRELIAQAEPAKPPGARPGLKTEFGDGAAQAADDGVLLDTEDPTCRRMVAIEFGM